MKRHLLMALALTMSGPADAATNTYFVCSTGVIFRHKATSYRSSLFLVADDSATVSSEQFKGLFLSEIERQYHDTMDYDNVSGVVCSSRGSDLEKAKSGLAFTDSIDDSPLLVEVPSAYDHGWVGSVVRTRKH
jgi:hypothetical protein